MLVAESWKEAYSKFYGSFGGSKTEDEFRNSLKNLRDHFDSHLDNARAGWMEEDGTAQRLSASNQVVFDELESLADDELWARVRPYAITAFSAKSASKGQKQAKKSGAKYFSSEFSGSQKRSAKAEVEVQVVPGFVVDALKQFVEAEHPGANVFNTQKIDLARDSGGPLDAIYEVKTSADTQSVYTAVGQLFMHSAGISGVEKIIVLPDTSENDDLVECLGILGIAILWYAVTEEICLFKPNQSNHSDAASCAGV